MTPTEKGRRFDALCHGESNRSLATMVVNRESDLEELRAENAKLREQAEFEHFQLGEMKRAAGMMLDEFVALKNGNARLATEYAKLRKLCSDVWHLFTEYGAVHQCDLPVVDAVRDRMRELGVEV